MYGCEKSDNFALTSIDLKWKLRASAVKLQNVKTCALALLTGCEDLLVQPYKTERDHLKKLKKVDSSVIVV